MSEHFVIIGNGAAGFRAAKGLRQADPALQISVFSEEAYPFYLRRQLGLFFAGDASIGELLFQSRNAYRRERIDLFLQTRVDRIDPDAHEVAFLSGERIRYDRLLVATGTDAAATNLPGATLAGALRLDTLGRALDARPVLRGVRRAVLLDEGVVALVLAEALAGRDIEVTQLIAGDRYWPDELDRETSQLVEQMLESHGVQLRRHTGARSIVGAAGRVIGVETADGDVVAAELAAFGSDRRPALEAALGAGLEIGTGLRVDGRFRTNRPDVFAAGDVAEPVGGPGGGTFCWQRAWLQGDGAAAGMLDRDPQPGTDVLRVRTTVFGYDLAVLGAGARHATGDVVSTERRTSEGAFQRLLFEQRRLSGAVVFGTGRGVHELAQLVADGASREAAEAVLGEPAADAAGGIPHPLARHCPICAAELVVHAGTQSGTVLRCHACGTDLVIRWDGTHGRLDVLDA